MKENILKLRSEGLSCKKISNIIGVSENTVKYHVYPKKKEWLRQYKKRRSFKLLKDARDQFGGKCQTCGYDRCQAALHFHHKNREDKLFCISRGKEVSKQKFSDELKKCVLLCSNCHMELEHPNGSQQ